MKKIILPILLMLLPLMAISDDSGMCGDGLTYSYTTSTKTLTISKTSEGTGEMKIESYNSPWSAYSLDIINIVIEFGVTSIAPKAFYCFENLESVELPESIVSIGNGAFTYCFSLKSLKIPDSVNTIGRDAFAYCQKLSSVSLPDKLRKIDFQVFDGCKSLSSITIPPNVNEIEPSAFWNCSGLESIVVDKDNIIYDSRDNCNAIIETSTNTLIIGCKNTTIIDSIKAIGGYAFWGCSGLSSLFIPNSVVNIGFEAFFQCSGLASIDVDPNNTVYDSRNNCNAIISKNDRTLILGCKNTIIPNDVESISDDAFNKCTGLISLKIPDSVLKIGKDAFADCSNLSTIEISNNLQYIGSSAFQSCSCLMDFCIPNSVIYIGDNAFNSTGWHLNHDEGWMYKDGWFLGYRGILVDMPREIEISDGTKGISDSWALFLESVNIPSGVKYICGHTFWQSKIRNVVFPSSVEYIEGFERCPNLTSIFILGNVGLIENSFSYCENLKDVYCYSETVPDLRFSFYSQYSNIIHATLHVPANSLDLYKNDYYWGKFESIVPLTDNDTVPTNVHTLQKRNNATPITMYSLDGKLISKPQRGLNIIRISDGTTKKVYKR